MAHASQIDRVHRVVASLNNREGVSCRLAVAGTRGALWPAERLVSTVFIGSD